MKSLIRLKYIDAPGAAPNPEFMSPGELALNRSDGVLYYLHADGDIRTIRTNEISLGGIGLISTEEEFPGITYDKFGGLYVDSTVLTTIQGRSYSVEADIDFDSLPTSSEVATQANQFPTLGVVKNLDIDQGYF